MMAAAVAAGLAMAVAGHSGGGVAGGKGGVGGGPATADLDAAPGAPVRAADAPDAGSRGSNWALPAVRVVYGPVRPVQRRPALPYRHIRQWLSSVGIVPESRLPKSSR